MTSHELANKLLSLPDRLLLNDKLNGTDVTVKIYDDNRIITLYGTDNPITVEVEYKKVNKVHKSSHFAPTPVEIAYYL